MKKIKPVLSKKHLKHARKVASSSDYENFRAKIILEHWNAERPHFGGGGPHRYNTAKDKECCYCGRPRDWKCVNAGFVASEVVGEY